MIDLEIYADKLAGRAVRIIREAEQEAQRRGHRQVTPEHILAVTAKLEAAVFNRVLNGLNHVPQIAAQEIDAKLARHKGGKNLAGMSDGTRWLLQYSLIHAHQQSRRLIELEDLLNVYFASRQSFFERLQSVFRSLRT